MRRFVGPVATSAIVVSNVMGALGCVPTAAVRRGPAEAPSRNGCRAPQAPYSRFELAVLGSGGPVAAGRAASSYAIFVDGHARLLVDVGPGAFVRLGEMGVDVKSLDTLLITHLHIDHSGDLPGFVKSRDLSSDGPLVFRIFGPAAGGEFPSASAFVDRLFGPQGAFAYLSNFRNALHFEVTDLPTRMDAPVREVLKEDDLHVTSIAVDHGDAPAVAFRVEHAGRALVISGDLASKSDNLALLAKDADLLVYDATVVDPPGSPAALYALHTPPRRIGEIAAAAGVKSVLLSHITRSVEQASGDVLRSVHVNFTGETRMAEDCLRIDLTAP